MSDKRKSISLRDYICRFFSVLLMKITLILDVFGRNWELFIVLLFAIILCEQVDEKDVQNPEVASLIIRLSSLTAAIIIGFLTAYTIQIRRERIELKKDIFFYTQKLTSFRRIANALLRSNDFWRTPEGTNMSLGRYIHNYHSSVSYFEFRVSNIRRDEFLAFSMDTKIYDSKNLFIELEQLVLTNLADETSIYSEFDIINFYTVEELEKLFLSGCGNGLYHFFENKRAAHRASFDFNAIPVERREIIEREISRIDQNRYKELNIGSEMLGLLGTQMYEDVIPKLYFLQTEVEKPFPFILNYLYFVLTVFMIFGVIIPTIEILLELSLGSLLVCSTLVLSATLYLILSYKKFLIQEIRILT